MEHPGITHSNTSTDPAGCYQPENIGIITPRDIAYSGVFGAAGLLLPVVFHLFHLGSFFMPMYLPLVTLGFFAQPVPAAMTALLTPLVSGLTTGMPPFFPPVAPIMGVELATMAALIAMVRRRWPSGNVYAVLIPVLFLGRCLNVGLVYLAAMFMHLPAKFVAGASLLSGWPGVVLMLLVIPSVVHLSHRTQFARRERR